MKTNFSKLVMVATCFAIISSSCKKEGPMGPAGAAGADGTNGVSNIETYEDNLGADVYVPVITDAGFEGTTSLLSVFIPDLRQGDVISVVAESQLEDEFDLNYATIVESVIGLASNDASNPTSTGWNTIVSEPAHYWLLNEDTYTNEDNACIYTCMSDLGDKHLNFVVRVKSGSAMADDLVKAQYASSHLDVAVFKAPQ